jgi:hypothetical protein
VNTASIERSLTRLFIIYSRKNALPREGAGAIDGSSDLLQLLGAYPALLRALVRAERIGKRRWTLFFSDGGSILLPAEDAGAALARAVVVASRLCERAPAIDVRTHHTFIGAAPKVRAGERAARQCVPQAPSRAHTTRPGPPAANVGARGFFDAGQFPHCKIARAFSRAAVSRALRQACAQARGLADMRPQRAKRFCGRDCGGVRVDRRVDTIERDAKTLGKSS